MKVTIERVNEFIWDNASILSWSETVGEVWVNDKRETYLTLKCSCGKVKPVRANGLFSFQSKSCGSCCQLNNTRGKTHGETHTRIHRIWNNMKQRVSNPKNIKYKNYGGRGIKICSEWRTSFTVFRDWALSNGYQDTLSIERVDNDGDYCPSNCVWATNLEQSRNKTSSRFITLHGKTQLLSDWIRELKISGTCVHYRVRERGMTYEQALLTPVRKQAKINKPK